MKSVKLSAIQSNEKALSKEELEFNKRWKKVQSLEKRNLRLKNEVSEFAKTIMENIQDSEKQMQASTVLMVEKLLSFAGRKSLSQWQKETLFLWIKENIQSLYDNPFSDQKIVEELEAQYLNVVGDFYNIDSEVLSGQQDQTMFDEEDDFDAMNQALDEMAQKMAEEMGVDVEDIKAQFANQFGDEFFEQAGFDQDFAGNNEAEKATDKIFKKSSINKMFKKIASVIHPDKAQNNEVKDKHHELMSILSTARDNNDLLTIVSMYEQYVGQSAFELIGADMTQINELLKKRIQTLNAEKENIVHENPINGALYKRFKKASKAKTQSAINEHKAENKEFIEAHKAFLKQITSLQKLKPILEEKYYQLNPFF